MYGPIFVEIENSRIYIQSELTDKDKCKSLPGSRWSKENRQWHVPVSWATCKQLRSVFGDRLNIGPKLLSWAKEEVACRIAPSVALRDAMTVSDPGGLVHGLYPFQQAGAHFLITAKQALLGDPMGAGKTVQTLAALSAVSAFPALVICPNSMKRTWGREANKWIPGIPVYIVEGTAAKRNQILAEAADNPGVVIINWESVRLHSRLAPYGSIALTDKEKEVKQLNQIPFKAVVADEAHRMKDPKSKQTRAVWAVAHNPMVEYRWALSGTPLTKKPDTLWPILHFMNPLEWPGKTAFVERYCLSSLNVWGGLEVFGINPNTEKEFFDIFDPRFRRMPKEVILPQLPPIIEEIRYVEMNPKQRKAYDSMVEHLMAFDNEGNMVVASNPISQLTRCTQYASAYLEVDSEGNARLSDPSCKLDQLMEDLEDISEPVVVFAVSRQLIEMASARLEKVNIRHSVVKGGQTNDQRQNAIDDFQNGNVDVILVVTAAGGVGITLTRSRIAIFLQRSWSNVDQQQAIGRVHRIGSEIHESVVILNYVTQGTIEEGQLAVLAGKADSLEEIIRDKQAIRKLLKGE
jgi:SNF2 family DNA or RNA helicase